MTNHRAKVNVLTFVLFMPLAAAIASIQWWVDQNSWRYYYQIALISALLFVTGLVAIATQQLAEYIIHRTEQNKTLRRGNINHAA